MGDLGAIEEFIKARSKARQAVKNKTKAKRLTYARAFIAGLITSYLPHIQHTPLQPLQNNLVKDMAEIASSVNEEMATYLIGTAYTAMLPKDFRGENGVFYTPPSVVSRLLDLAEEGGTDWGGTKIVDPACGGGAFLAPVARKIVKNLPHLSPEQRIEHIESHVKGYEIDYFSAWTSQVFVELALRSDIELAGRALKDLVSVQDSLKIPEAEYGSYDLVIGNPPYGKTKLLPEERDYWSRSLYGHANQYGLFTDLGIRLARSGGVIAYVTPTSFLGGQYFKSLRGVLGREAPPVAFDFIAHREGVFADVLQETMLSCYRKDSGHNRVSISYLTVKETGGLTVKTNGNYALPKPAELPWILPRKPKQAYIVEACCSMPWRLRDLGYTVSTGPMVWNRHKSKLRKEYEPGAIPLIWAECVDPNGSGSFQFKTDMRTKYHLPWYVPSGDDESNIVRNTCVLLQRTTAVEQPRRLIAAALPTFLINKYNAVTVENHLNMVKPIVGVKKLVGTREIAAFFNSEVADQVFRCINGSTAVSAYELESMPLPSPEAFQKLRELLQQKADKETIDQAIKEMYTNVYTSAAANDC